MRGKKYIIGALAVCLAGCTENTAASTTEAATAAAVKDADVWYQEPELDFDNAGDLKPFNYEIQAAKTTTFGDVTLYIETEKTGYPGEWNNDGYNGDAMLVEKNNKQGIYTHDGKELYAVSVDKVSTPYIAGIVPAPYKDSDGKTKTAYGFANTSTSKAQIFSSDFKSVSEVVLDQFSYDFKISSTDPYLALQGDTLGIAGMSHSSSGAMSGWKFEKYTPTDIKDKMIVPVIDEQFVNKGYAIVNTDGTVEGNLDTSMSYRTGSFVNGFYTISDGTYTTLIQAASNQGVAIQYQDAKYFEDGYAPVKKSGKWGYIDETGKEVTDFIFDDASTVYNGYAWVYYNGKYGIINITDTIKDGKKQINAYWCATSSEEKIGKVTVNISNLTIRKGAGSDSAQEGICMEGAVYPVYEQKKDSDYTWYRINETEWIANDGSWATYEASK